MRDGPHSRRPPRGRRPRATSVSTRTPYTSSPARTSSRDDPRRVVAAPPPRTPAPRSPSRPRRRPARASSAGAPGGDELAAGDDRHAVADQLDLARAGASSAAPRRRASAAPRAASRTVRRPAGSSALVGSSSSSSRGEPIIACAMPEPLLHALRHRADAAVAAPRARPTSSSSSPRSAAPPSEPASRWWSCDSSSRAQPVGEAEQLGEVADRACAAGVPAGAPRDLRRPPVGRTSPQAIFTSVDLPAPLGPSSPISSPSRTSRSTPSQRLGASVALAQVGRRRGPGASVQARSAVAALLHNLHGAAALS